MTNKTGEKNKLSPDERREMTLRALAGEPRDYLAAEYGVSRQTLQKNIRAAKRITEADVAEARREYAFRRKVWEMPG